MREKSTFWSKEGGVTGLVAVGLSIMLHHKEGQTEVYKTKIIILMRKIFTLSYLSMTSWIQCFAAALTFQTELVPVFTQR